MAKKKRESRRRKLTCQCGEEFSTYSSNRTVCHKCKPKCKRRTIFHGPGARLRPKPVEKAAEPKPEEQKPAEEEKQDESQQKVG